MYNTVYSHGMSYKLHQKLVGYIITRVLQCFKGLDIDTPSRGFVRPKFNQRGHTHFCIVQSFAKLTKMHIALRIVGGYGIAVIFESELVSLVISLFSV